MLKLKLGLHYVRVNEICDIVARVLERTVLAPHELLTVRNWYFVTLNYLLRFAIFVRLHFADKLAVEVHRVGVPRKLVPLEYDIK